ncbi:hypothetical protein [Candidatus Nitrospira bockiana]
MSHQYPSLSPIQLQQHPDGTCTVAGMPGITVEVNQDPEPVRDWVSELQLPADLGDYSSPELRRRYEPLARPRGLSNRRLWLIVVDETPPRIPAARQHPHQLSFALGGQLLTLEHLGFAIGVCEDIVPGVPSSDEWYEHAAAIQRVPEAVGAFIVGTARLYNSALADAAWLGLERGIFGHVCPVIFRATGEPAGTGELVEIALTHRPVFPGSRVLKWWEGDVGARSYQPK